MKCRSKQYIIITYKYSYSIFYIMCWTHMNLINVFIFTVKTFAYTFYHVKLVTLALHTYGWFLTKIARQDLPNNNFT